MNKAPPRPDRKAREDTRAFRRDAAAAAEGTAADRKAERIRRRAQARRDRMAAFIIGTLAIIIVIAVISLAVSAGENRARYTVPETTTVPDSVRYMGYDVAFYPDLPANELDADAFSVGENGLLMYDDGETVSENGVDVSEHQGEINWKKVAAAGIDFAFLRIGYRGYTEGGLYEDARFELNYYGARAADIKVGVYFYSQAVTVAEALKEAEYVLELLDDRKLDLPVVLDWEYADADEARTDSIGGSLLTSIGAAFCGRIQRSGYPAAIYFNKDTGYVHYDLSALADYPFWIADYNTTPLFYYAHEYWQYSDAGTIDGISEPVDLNLRFVSKH